MNYHDDYEIEMEKEILFGMKSGVRITNAALEKAAQMMKDGFTDIEVRKACGLSVSSMYRYRRDGLLPYNGHHITGKTFVPKDVKLPELQPGQRMDGTPATRLQDLPYKEEPETEIPFTDIYGEDIDVPTTPVEVETPHNTPETACKPEIAVSEADKGKSGLVKVERIITLYGPWHKMEIEDDNVKLSMSIINKPMEAEKAYKLLEDMIAELSEMKLALGAGVY